MRLHDLANHHVSLELGFIWRHRTRYTGDGRIATSNLELGPHTRACQNGRRMNWAKERALGKKRHINNAGGEHDCCVTSGGATERASPQ